MAPRRRILYDQKCRKSLPSHIRQTHEWACSRSLFNLEFIDLIAKHPLSPPNFIKSICKGWCLLNDHAHRDNSVHETLLPSIEEGKTLKDSTTSDLKSLIWMIHLGEARWVGRLYRCSSFLTRGRSKWEALVRYCLDWYHLEIDVVGMTKWH